jgi:hypothetical protein
MSLADHIESLSNVVEVLEERDVDVEDIGDIEDYGHRDDLLVDVRLAIPATVESRNDASAEQNSTDGQADSVERSPGETAGGESVENQSSADEDNPPETRYVDEDDRESAERHECPHCDYATDSERGLAIHEGRVHDDNNGGQSDNSDSVDGIKEHNGTADSGDQDSEEQATGEKDGEQRSGEEHKVDEVSGGSLSEDTPETEVSAEEAEDWTAHCSKCDAEFDSNLAYALHRTEVHGTPQRTVDNLEPGEFAERVAEMDSIVGLADDLGWSTERVLRTLGAYGLGDAAAGIDDVDDVTPDWLDEASFHAAVKDNENVEDLACTLGWEYDDLDGLRWLVEFVGVDDQLDGTENQEGVA